MFLQHAEDEKWEISPITYIGHSLGGYLAQEALLNDTSGGAGAVVFNSTGHRNVYVLLNGALV